MRSFARRACATLARLARTVEFRDWFLVLLALAMVHVLCQAFVACAAYRQDRQEEAQYGVTIVDTCAVHRDAGAHRR